MGGTIPSAIGGLTKLRVLNLGSRQLYVSDELRNNMTGTIPPALGGLTHLRHLNLQGNLLTGSVPDSFVDLTNLETLKLVQEGHSGLHLLWAPSALRTLCKEMEDARNTTMLAGCRTMAAKKPEEGPAAASPATSQGSRHKDCARHEEATPKPAAGVGMSLI